MTFFQFNERFLPLRVAELHEGVLQGESLRGGEETSETDDEDKLEHDLTEIISTVVLGTLKDSNRTEVYIG